MNLGLVYKHLEHYLEECSLAEDKHTLEKVAVKLYQFCQKTSFSLLVDSKTKGYMNILQHKQNDITDAITKSHRFVTKVMDSIAGKSKAMKTLHEKQYQVPQSFNTPFLERPDETYTFQKLVIFLEKELPRLLEKSYKYTQNRIMSAVEVKETIIPVLNVVMELVFDVHNVIYSANLKDTIQEKELLDEGVDIKDDLRELQLKISHEAYVTSASAWFDFLLISEPSLITSRVRGHEPAWQLSCIVFRVRQLTLSDIAQVLRIVINDLLEEVVSKAVANNGEERVYKQIREQIHNETSQIYDTTKVDITYVVDIGGQQIQFTLKNRSIGREREKTEVVTCKLIGGQTMFGEVTGRIKGNLAPKWILLSVFLIHSVNCAQNSLLEKEYICKHAPTFRRKEIRHAYTSLKIWFIHNTKSDLTKVIYRETGTNWKRSFPDAKEVSSDEVV